MAKDANDWTSVRILKADREELYRLRDALVDMPLDNLTSPLSSDAQKRLVSEPILSEADVELLRSLDSRAYSRGVIAGLAVRIALRVVSAIAPDEEKEKKRK